MYMREERHGAEIAEVYPDSIAAGLALAPGDVLLSVNGEAVADLIQLQWAWAGETVEIEVLTKKGVKRFVIDKDYDENPGIGFAQPVFDGIRLCVNHCPFCFVDQMPQGCRESLYIKDDDYRLSFLQGSYITMTNLSAEDLRRIEAEKLSPLYVSIHAADPEIRKALLGRPEGDGLLDTMARLGAVGIQYHCQIVLCPGWNDGAVLQDTVDTLGDLDGVLSVAVVPVGLTGHRAGLSEIRAVDKADADKLIDWLAQVQAGFLAKKGSRFVWLADEFYILAGQEMPDDETYEDYPQWANGVGMVRSFLAEASAYPLPAALEEDRHLILAGGTGAMEALGPLWREMRKIRGLTLEIVALENRFFGPRVTVSGLLTGKCLIEGLGQQAYPPGTQVFLPATALRDGEDVFLDGLSADQVSQALGLQLVFVPGDGYDAMVALLGRPQGT